MSKSNRSPESASWAPTDKELRQPGACLYRSSGWGAHHRGPYEVEQEVDQWPLGINYSGFLTFWSHDGFTLEKKIKGSPKSFVLTVWDLKDWYLLY